MKVKGTPAIQLLRFSAGRRSDSGYLIGFLLLGSLAMMPVKADDDSLGRPVQPVYEIRDLQGNTLLGEYVLRADVPAGSIDRVMKHDTLAYFSEVEESLRSGANPSSLNWHANSGEKISVQSDSRIEMLSLELVNRSNESEFLLEVVGVHAIAWHYIDSQGNRTVHNDDFSLPLIGRPIFDAQPVMPLKLAPGERVQILIAAWLITGEGLVSIVLWEPEHFRAQRAQRYLVDGVYFGLAIAIVIAALVLGLTLRQPEYLYFALFVASGAGLIYVSSGLSTIFGLGDKTSYAVPLFFLSFACIGIFSSLFSMSILDMKQTHLKLYYFYLGFLVYNVCSSSALLWLTGSTQISSDAMSIALVVGAFGFLLSQGGHLYAVVYYFRRTSIALFWYVGIMVHSVALIAWVLLIDSNVDTDVDRRYFVQFVIVLDALMLFSLMLYRYRREHTSRLEAQQQSYENLRLAHDLEKSKANFVATVGHDLRGPVQAISHFVQSMSSDATPADASKLGKINDNVSTISGILDSMISLSKLEWQAAKPNLQDVELAPLIAELRSEFGGKAAEKGLRLEFDGNGCRAVTDRVCLGQVLRNLVDNAIKYSDAGCVRLIAKNQDNAVWIVVEDSGRGIHQRDLENIFDEFYRAADAARSIEGVGIGLSIVARLTKLLDIELNVSSEYGQGTRFELRLPEFIDDDIQPPVNIEASSADHAGLGGALTSVQILVIGTEADDLDAQINSLQDWQARVVQYTIQGQHMELGNYDPDLILVSAAVYELIDPTADIPVNTPVLVIGGMGVATSAYDHHLMLEADVTPMKLRSLIQRMLVSTSHTETLP